MDYFSTPKMEVVRFSIRTTNVYRTTRGHIPEEKYLQSYSYENLKSNFDFFFPNFPFSSLIFTSFSSSSLTYSSRPPFASYSVPRLSHFASFRTLAHAIKSSPRSEVNRVKEKLIQVLTAKFPTNCMEQSACWESDSLSADQEMPRLLRYLKVH
jgi:hypothetical protein